MNAIKLAPKRKRPRRVARKIWTRFGIAHHRDVPRGWHCPDCIPIFGLNHEQYDILTRCMQHAGFGVGVTLIGDLSALDEDSAAMSPSLPDAQSVSLHAGPEPVCVRVEHLCRPGAVAFCRVRSRCSSGDDLGMFRSDADDGYAIEAGVFCEAPRAVMLLGGSPAGTAWVLLRRDA